MVFTTELFDYQQAAVDKLSRLRVMALYMEMGTGKTRTMLEIIDRKIEKGKADMVLWLCPCSVIHNLREEIRFQCGEVPDCIRIAGIQSVQGSDRLYLELLELVGSKRVFLVVDESNMVKNFFAKRTRRITEISRKCPYRAILNGTPVSRNEADMFAQWYILDERILGYKSYYSFAANHLEYKTVRLPGGDRIKTDQVARVLNVDYLTEKIAPYSYQIRKKETGIELPPKRYYYRGFGLLEKQEEEYEWTKAEYLEKVDEFRSETIYKLFTALQHVTSGRRVLTGPTKRMKTADMYSWDENPRIKRLAEVLDEIGDEQAIIFAKYQSEIDEIGKLLESRGLSFREFTGRVNRKQRERNRDDFRNGVRFLLANKMCGAYGLNLQFCRNVIFYSNDFDYATREQAEDRVHRIGQTREVHIYDIYAIGTIDDFIDENLRNKTSMVASFKRWIDEQKNKKPEELLSEKRTEPEADGADGTCKPTK